MIWNDVGFVLRSRQRKEILFLLKTEKTPSLVARHMKSSISNVSLKLADLEKRGIIRCINPKDRKGRIYSLTTKGNEVAKKIEKMEQKEK